MNNIPLFPTKLPPTFLRPKGYMGGSDPINTQTEPAPTSTETQAHVPIVIQEVVVQQPTNEKLKSVVSVPTAQPVPKHLIFRNSFQIPLALLIYGMLYVRGFL